MKTQFLTVMIFVIFAVPALAKNINKVAIATYNVENLFDLEHDEGKNDFQFLPHSHPLKKSGCESHNTGNQRKSCLEIDWTEERLKIKLDQIKYAVMTLPSFPDILALVEVENQNVVEMLKNHLGYDHAIVTNSGDERGIDVAILYRNSPHFLMNKTVTHTFQDEIFFKNKTRDILEVQFDIKGELVSFFVNHWPSQGNSDEMRMAAASELIKAIQLAMSNDGVSKIIATGDFNTVDDDMLNPIKQLVLQPFEIRNGSEKHELFDLDSQFLKDGTIAFRLKKQKPLGTYFFAGGMGWNLLDRFFMSQSLFDRNSNIQVETSSYKIHNLLKLTTTFTYNDPDLAHMGSTINGIPLRYNHNTSELDQAGFSDHFAIYTELKIKP
jgi:predicted extracellular nuclease